ncbi:MAG: hypothetical protein ACLFVJ_20390 [Persicimonas sp.]
MRPNTTWSFSWPATERDQGNERERIALLEQFYEQLTSGRLDDVAQLEMLAMAEGAKTLDTRSLRAMRRMVEQNAKTEASPETKKRPELIIATNSGRYVRLQILA